MSDLITRLKAPASYNQDYYDLHIEAANKIERLERELAEEKRLHESTQDELGRVLLDLNDTEAQCAAMREALERYLTWLDQTGGDGEFEWYAWEQELREALAPDAGQKVLDVVKRTQELIEAIDAGALEMNSPEIGGDSEDSGPPHRWHEEWLHLTRQTLSALGWKK